MWTGNSFSPHKFFAVIRLFFLLFSESGPGSEILESSGSHKEDYRKLNGAVFYWLLYVCFNHSVVNIGCFSEILSFNLRIFPRNYFLKISAFYVGLSIILSHSCLSSFLLQYIYDNTPYSR